jgi:hypothetical protein
LRVFSCPPTRSIFFLDYIRYAHRQVAGSYATAADMDGRAFPAGRNSIGYRPYFVFSGDAQCAGEICFAAIA